MISWWFYLTSGGFLIFVCPKLKLRGRPPIWRGGLCTYSCALGTRSDCLKNRERFMFPWNSFFCFSILGTHTRRDIQKWYFSFGRPVGCFGGACRSVVTFCCVFVATRNVACPCSALGLFWAVSTQDFLCFLCAGPIFWALWGPPCFFFAPRIHKVTHLCQLAPPDHQLGGK